MREIKFRGLTIGENSCWAIGYLCKKFEDDVRIYDPKMRVWSSVIVDTVGEYTGLPDYDGIAIYEGDILCEPHHGEAVTVEWKCGGFIAKFENGDEVTLANIARYCRVIGNIHEED